MNFLPLLLGLILQLSEDSHNAFPTSVFPTPGETLLSFSSSLYDVTISPKKPEEYALTTPGAEYKLFCIVSSAQKSPRIVAFSLFVQSYQLLMETCWIFAYEQRVAGAEFW